MIIIVCILCFRLFFIEQQIDYFTEESKDKPLSIVSNWDNGSGFYSQIFFKLNHYLYCKKYNINFTMKAHSSGPYTIKDGWTDYFEDVKLTYTNTDSTKLSDIANIKSVEGCCIYLENFPINDYIAIIPEFYKYNEETLKHINKIKDQLDINNKEYGAVYIRRGDKLVNETTYVPSEKFVDILLEKMPNCKILFVQTDDYNSYLEIKNYIENNLKKDIKVLTTCPNDRFGTIANSGYTEKILQNNVDNSSKDYMTKIKEKLSKPIEDMNIEERKEHTLELLTGVEICINSHVIVCDIASNVSRFIRIAHNDINSVFDIHGRLTDPHIN